jgi:glucokinase
MEENLVGRLLFGWEEIEATEVLVEQVATEFGGEDPLKLASRTGLGRARDMAEKQALVLEAMGHKVDLPAASEEEVQELKAMLERNGCVFRR